MPLLLTISYTEIRLNLNICKSSSWCKSDIKTTRRFCTNRRFCVLEFPQKFHVEHITAVWCVFLSWGSDPSTRPMIDKIKYCEILKFNTLKMKSGMKSKHFEKTKVFWTKISVLSGKATRKKWLRWLKWLQKSVKNWKNAWFIAMTLNKIVNA